MEGRFRVDFGGFRVTVDFRGDGWRVYPRFEVEAPGVYFGTSEEVVKEFFFALGVAFAKWLTGMHPGFISREDVEKVFKFYEEEKSDC